MIENKEEKRYRVIEFKGFSKSGKTSSIESLITYLKTQEKLVSAIKFIHIDNFSIDTPGKNTWRMSEAGATPVVSTGYKETAFIIKKSLKLNQIIRINNLINYEINSNKKTQDEGKIDIFLAEGYYDGTNPLILTMKSEKDIPDLLKLIFEKSNPIKILMSIICISGVISELLGTKNKKKLFSEELMIQIRALCKEKRLNLTLEQVSYIKKIPIINLKNNPEKIMDLLELQK